MRASVSDADTAETSGATADTVRLGERIDASHAIHISESRTPVDDTRDTVTICDARDNAKKWNSPHPDECGTSR